ncbi:MAG: anthranilate synthase component I [Actinomycetes bacterium]
MPDGFVRPSREEFRSLGPEYRLVPVTRRLLADDETPVGVYRKLAGNRAGTFLLESAEHGRVWSRYSFVGVHCQATLTERDGRAVWVGTPPSFAAEHNGGDPLVALRDTIERLRTPRIAGLPPLTSGVVGYIGYDAVRRLERLPSTAPDDLGMPELAMMLVTDLAVLDHSDGTILLVANAFRDDRAVDDDTAYDDAVARLDAMTTELSKPAEPSVVSVTASPTTAYDRRTEATAYMRSVELVKEQIRAGEAFQVVLSQRFEMSTDADALDVYRVLRAANPSPYMYLLRFPGRERPFEVVGSSPEALVKVNDGHALLHPIAGTRPRGATAEDDARLAAELLADPKERAEHVMLVDLGRNDLGRVCTPDSVEVLEFFSIERYSHVMHLVSTVVGQVAPPHTAYDVLAACFPAGTLSGAPKPRAMEIIEELEPVRRNLYGGAVGYLDVHGDLDTAIAIRTVVLHDGCAYVQAGAGIVADSDPAAEERECQAKAAVVLAAVAAAATLRPAP